MDRILISRDLNSGKYILLVIGFIIITVLFINPYNKESLLAGVTLLTIATVFYCLLDKAKKVEFDEKNMIISLNTNIEIIPFIDVQTIKLTMTRINYSSLWKIKYIDNNGIQKSVRILPNLKNFEKFIENIKRTNPNIKIIRMSHSFDFDQ